MKPIDPALVLALCVAVIATADAGDSPAYYGTDQPFAHPAPPSLGSVPPRTYIPTAPRTFVPVASQHVFSDSRLPTSTDTTARLFIRAYDREHGVYVNEEVVDPGCLNACLGH